jgi:hypothetical protein
MSEACEWCGARHKGICFGVSRTLSDEIREEQRLLTRRFIRATMKKGPLSLVEAIEICKQMESA